MYSTIFNEYPVSSGTMQKIRVNPVGMELELLGRLEHKYSDL